MVTTTNRWRILLVMGVVGLLVVIFTAPGGGPMDKVRYRLGIDRQAAGPSITAYQCWTTAEPAPEQSFDQLAAATYPKQDIPDASKGYWRVIVAGMNGQGDPNQFDLNAVSPNTEGKVLVKIPKPCSPPSARPLGQPPGPGDTPVADFKPAPEPKGK